MGTYNCPAHRGVERARVAGADAFANDAQARATGAALSSLMDRFDASRECAEVTCLYHGVNWWLEKLAQEPGAEVALEPGDERGDFFL